MNRRLWKRNKNNKNKNRRSKKRRNKKNKNNHQLPKNLKRRRRNDCFIMEIIENTY